MAIRILAIVWIVVLGVFVYDVAEQLVEARVKQIERIG
jgi:hypothetical protein